MSKKHNHNVYFTKTKERSSTFAVFLFDLARVEISLLVYLRNDFVTLRKVPDENIKLSVTDSSGTCIVAGTLPLSSRKNTHVLRRFSSHKAPPSIFFRFYLSSFFLHSPVPFLLLHNPLHLSASVDILLGHSLMIFYLALSSIFFDEAATVHVDEQKKNASTYNIFDRWFTMALELTVI